MPKYHAGRLEKLKELTLEEVLGRKNPYLFRAKNFKTPQDLVRSLLDAHLSSQEETLFGGILERLAVSICAIVYGGQKSTTAGIDLEFQKDGIRYIVCIKSGPHWGNRDQKLRMIQNFQSARQTLTTNVLQPPNIVAVNGCCYGRGTVARRGGYLEVCGEDFWTLISGDSTLYKRIADPMAHKASECDSQFQAEYEKVVEAFAKDFASCYCDEGDLICWDRIVERISKTKPQRVSKPKAAKSAAKNKGTAKKSK